MAILKGIEVLLKKYPLGRNGRIQYGTSGFRQNADHLPHVAFRVGIFATLRARFTKATIGAIITASHNPEQDNGIKLIDPSGGMLDEGWESIVTELANVPAAGGSATNFGLLTTPQLHYIVRCVNTDGLYGVASEEGYYNKLASAYLRLTELTGQSANYQPHVVVDAANGVGALQLAKLAPLLKAKLTFDIVHDANGVLNYQCGADFVKVNQREPQSVQPLKPGQRYASFDGDADRIIYYYQNSKDGKFRMLDGDKIAVLIAKYLKETLTKAQLADVKVSIVQTAYANGSSTIYMRDVLQMDTFCVPTGVKHLHRKAEHCQIGVYFEANGHGTILFSNEVNERIKQSSSNVYAQQLMHFIDLVNETVGDAISDMLIVESILNSLALTIEEWDELYTDLPNRLLKQEVKDRNAITTTDAERKCVTPAGLQAAIDQVVATFGTKARSFVRPSGTEDVVRIYAEADTQDAADLLAKKVANLVFDLASGVAWNKFQE
ncbi:Phosphoglucomutase-3 [Tyrophagus putrescentiae]|nr:Phosphoglucomutase-3 [Tyrophagus putrescentiae]